ncbi:MAG TPA: hypothetical protein VG736_11735 [Vicinamibacterales bacterium]|nr:hypothetical protein [Vicinamibacterales bacterium]
MTPTRSPRGRTSTLAFALDLAALLLIAAGVLIELTGGFRIDIAGVQVSAHGGGRAFGAALLLIAARVLVDRAQPVLGLTRDHWRALWRRVYRPDAWIVPDPSPTRPSHVLWAACGLMAVGAVLLHEQLAHMRSVPDLGDPLFSVWRLNWVFHQLQGDPRPLFDTNIYYPHPLTLTYSDSMLLPALMHAPLIAAGLHPVVAYNVLFMSAFVLSGLAVFLLVAHLTGSRQAAFISATIFGFYPYRFEHYSHLELQMMMWMPLALLALHRFVETARLRYALAAAAATVAQLYSTMYYTVFFVLYLVPVTAILVRVKRAPIRRLVPGTIVAGVLAAMCAFPLMRVYEAAQGEKGERDVNAVMYYSATPADYFHAHYRSVLYGRVIKSEHPERALFPGVMALGLATAGLVPPLGPLSLVYGAGMAFAWESSLGYNGTLYPLFYKWLSPVRGMRVASRFSVLVGLSLAIFAGFGVRRLLERCPRPWQRQALVAGLTALIAIDVSARLGLEPVWDAPPPIYESVPRSPKTVLAEFPIRQHVGSFTESVPFMYFSLWHWSNMIDGYSGFSPRDYADLVTRVEDVPEPQAIDALRAAGVTHVTFSCALYYSPEGCEELLTQVEASPHFRRLVRLRWHGSTAALYELR